jgi:hypothetical protein
MISHATKYATNPEPPRRRKRIKANLISVGSMLKYSPNPPHTPAMILFVLERKSWLYISF